MKREYILCVDDEAIILTSLRMELQLEFRDELDIEVAHSGREALDLIAELDAADSRLAVLISDQRMPGMDGSELLKRVKASHPDVLAIMLTGYTDVDALKFALNEAGLFRLISKPWSSVDLRMASRRAVELRSSRLLNRDLLRQLGNLNQAILAVLENVINCHDPETFDHVRRVSSYTTIIARGAGLDSVMVQKLLVFSPLHDLGKVGIPQSILNKPGKLTPAEMSVMRTHVTIGARLMSSFGADPLLSEIVLRHHEWWDGRGYPDGLAGEAIPLSARIVAIADVFDALVSDRPYKAAMGFDEARRIVLDGRGRQFEPRLVDVFESNLDAVQAAMEGRYERTGFDILASDA